MKTIKILKKGKYELTHNRYMDDFGFLKDAFNLFDTEKRVHFPFLGFPKVTNFKRDEPVPTTTDYTDQEYEKMMDEQIKLYATLPKL